MIEFKRVPPLDVEQAQTRAAQDNNGVADIVWALTRYIDVDLKVSWADTLLLFDQIFQQAAHAQAADAELAQLKAMNDVGRVVAPPSAEMDAALDRFAEVGKEAWGDVADAGEWQRKIRGGFIPSMTLRDKFAMAALTGLPTTEQTPEHLVKTAYTIADAMLAARGQGLEGPLPDMRHDLV